MIKEHKHFIARIEAKSFFKSKEELNDWLILLVQKIDMQLAPISNNPNIWYCDDAGNKGFTGCCIITTSHLILHVWDEDEINVMQLDLYSCKDFTIETILNTLEEFEPLKIDYKFIDRGIELCMV